MAFIKTVKSKAYFKRYQTKYRRRREGKTDYYARKRLITQAKNKYHSPKYRLVVRFTNTNIVAQIIYAKIEGDHVMCAAYGKELSKYGVKAGYTNYAAAYATGLLLARRLLKKIGLDEKYQGQTKVDGAIFHVEELVDGPRPFTANLDVGINRTTTGSKIFGVLKGAVDGGLNVPHNEKRFPGYDAESKNFDPEVLRKRIFGEHVSEYMKALQADDPDRYKAQFSRFIKAGLNADSYVAQYKAAHAAIRKDPTFTKKEPKKPAVQKHFGKRALNLKQRKDKIRQKKAHFKKGAEA
jgi:large subunit ribosomal protein L5e